MDDDDDEEKNSPSTHSPDRQPDWLDARAAVGQPPMDPLWIC